MKDPDLVVVGAGLIGLATTAELLRRHPALQVVVLEKEAVPAAHQSGHNSGVLHAGLYYPPGSLKARLCVEGKAAMERFAAEHALPIQVCGKVVVALGESEFGRLQELHRRGVANGVPDLRLIDRAELIELEPHAAGHRAVHSPHTAIVDFAAAARALVGVIEARGGEVRFGAQVTGIARRPGEVVVATSAGEVVPRHLISCAGLHSDRVAALGGEDPGLAILPFRGDYYTLTPDARQLCRGLIYPVPDPDLPFLGVHFTRRTDGEVWAGPNAILATKREGYRRTDLAPRELWETVRYPGFRRLARRYWRLGAQEAWRDASKGAFLRQLQRYVPAVQRNHLTFGPSGVRAQALDREGALVDDFVIRGDARTLHVLNAPSPGATASLAIGAYLADRAREAFQLG